jgi:hypothetical protein
MEATAALGIAGNVVQFIDFSQKLCSTVSQVYRSTDGISSANSNTELVAKNLLLSLDRISADVANYRSHLERDIPTGTGGEGAADRDEMRKIIEGCRRVAAKLVSQLESLKAGRDPGKRKSLVVAVKAVWKKRELEDMEKELQNFRSQLEWRVVVALR